MTKPRKKPAPRSLPEETSADFPIVGIGASAGGLAAFEQFFSGLPAHTDPGMAFVLVQHLAPDHKSILSDLIRRCTRMPVFEVEDGMPVQVNCAYIIPPGRDMAFLNGALHLLTQSEPRRLRLPIDFFFRSLAQDQRERGIGIVLSGTGSDGTQGVRAIKGEGGMVMAQSPLSAEFDAMPRSAIATGLVDYELPPAEMPLPLIAYVQHVFGKLPRSAAVPPSAVEMAMRKVFVLLRDRTGHDFSQYKSSTVQRRIERRMAVHLLDDMNLYVRHLQQNPAEADALFRDLLIGVTRFFRDPEAFEALEAKVIPDLFAGKPAGSVVRVWIAACSTGEEAYSIAMLLVERMDVLKESFVLQMFATDIDARSIAVARAGIYGAGIAADVSPERLARFFTLDLNGGYRVNKSLRDLLVFSEQDVVRDPPFSKLDLLSCRNLLIYMTADLQRRVIPLFHYALKPGGVLFLGTSEGVGEFEASFTVADRGAKIFRRSEKAHGLQRPSEGRFLPSLAGPAAVHMRRDAEAAPGKPPLRELTEQALLDHFGSPAALVNAQGDILYLRGRSGCYLEPAPGEPGVNNIVKMAREGLRGPLTTTLHQVTSTGVLARTPGLRVKTNGHYTSVNLTVRPATANASTPNYPALYLVVLEEAADPVREEASPGAPRVSASGDGHLPDADARIAALEQDLRAKDEYLQSTLELLESSTEELKSANDKMQTVNEELQSSNEELETSKEELQSVNEELATVNTELQTKVTDLSRANNDMNNLLSGTGIGTVFVDHQLRILRFTPAVSSIIHLIPSDLGRPVSHIVSNLVGYTDLVADVTAVLNTLVSKELEVMSVDGRWYALRIQPYRTLEHAIEGAVISFLDITQMVETRTALRKAADLTRLGVVVRDAHDAITLQDLGGRILAWNPGAVRLFGWSEAEALRMNARDRIPKGRREEEMSKVAELCRAHALEPFATKRVTKGGATVDVSIVVTALVDEAGEVYAIATTERAREPAPR